MVPTPESEASTSTMNWREGSGEWRTGAQVNGSFKWEKARSAGWFQTNLLLEEVRACKGEATEL